ncbi:ligand-binding sensor domain-containing diguanylate cyclase [Niveispirillum sp.]|uniref:ligand-binding sensor domain-containing diguanylate cyclase n=1 Tax=Niveispirillum sp. TaxID=1917217 RepID=UPI001B5B9879|nr:ligand-binding sensor domain-containing diguanylate cyclase [Niveispirillum sp.]MBP7334568.1 diguanylate cyclase [Niveispirillum sp.]
MATGAEAEPWGDFPVLNFRDLTTDDGLPNDTISAVAQDKAGLIWIGTFAGLARYDGYRLHQWQSDPDDPDRLPEIYVRALLPLSDGGMLIGMGAAGLVRYDAQTDRFRRLTAANGPGARTYAISSARDVQGDAAWVAADDGLFLWRAPDNAVHPVPLLDAQGHPLNPRLFAVMEEANGDLWIGGMGGLMLRRAGQDFFTPVRVDGPAAGTINGEVWVIHRDPEGRLWIGSGDAGVAYLMPDGSAHAVAGLTGGTGLAGRRTIRSMVDVPGQGLWIATDGAGLIILDPATGRLRQVRHDPVLPGSPNGDRLRNIMRDRTGNVWLSTDQGVERYDPYADRLRVVPATPLSPLGLSNPEIYVAHTDTRSRVWLGLANGDVDVLDLPAGRVERLRMPPPNNGRDVRALVPMGDGRLLAATRGVAAIDMATMTTTPSVIPCLEGQVINVMIANGTEVIAGSFEGLTRFDSTTGECRRFRHNPADPSSLPNDNVRSLLVLSNGRLVVGTAAGLAVSDGRSGFRSHRPDMSDPDSLSHAYITGLAEDQHGRLWLSTAGGGLVVTDVEELGGKPHFRSIRRRNGLPHDNVGGIGVDEKGRVWFTTPSRVGMLDPQNSRFTLFGEREGANLKFYVLNRLVKGPGNHILLGGLGGLAILDMASDRPPPPPPVLRITGMEINHQPVAPGQLPGPNGRLLLASEQRTLSLAFSLLDFRAGGDLRYRHRLEGFDQDWLDSSNRAPGALYTNLPAGYYVLRTEVYQMGQEVPLATLSLPIRIDPFWYETLWARLGGLVLAVLAVAGIVQARTAALRRQRRRLAAEVADRTRDLLAANARLDMLASTDPLTGLLNRRRFLELAAAEQTRAGRHNRPLSVLLIDLDHFKRVNDAHGHRMGDAVLRTAAAVLSGAVRTSDLAARFGGEELVLLLPETDLAGAAGMAERLRQAFASAPTLLDGVEVRVTASLGVAAWRGPAESLDGLLHRADQALYAAKNAGRDRVMVATGMA